MTDAAARRLTLCLFGAFEARLGDTRLPRLRTRKAQWLLALLALRPGAEVARDWIAGTLWPDSREAAALANLRSVLKDLRGVLGPDAYRMRCPTARTLCLDLAGAHLDVREFDATVRADDPASLQRAVELYRGPLLDDCTEEWVFPERLAREQAYLAALETLAEQARARNDPAVAERWLRRVIAIDPLRESAHRALMQALTASGSTAAALAVYRELRQRLHQEINAAPDADTTALFERLRSEARAKAGSGRPRLGANAGEMNGPAAIAGGVASGRRHNLPPQLTSFIGREGAMAEVKQFLATTRLLTLTGSGGCGKTRLALQVAADRVEEYAHGVWMVELAALDDPALMPQAVASALGLREERGRPLFATLTDYLRPKSLLLVLDNCEHLLAASAQLADALLRGCPQLHILASSRERLGIGGEQTYRVPSLSLPDVRHLPPLENLRDFEAVQLFADRARLSQPTFAVTPANAPSVVQVCHRLDGIPLAIELAAARVRALPVEQINQRLEDMFHLLTDGSRTALPRHQTLRALIDWSYDLLSAGERTLLRRLSVFSGGWTLGAAEAVCSDLGFWIVDFGLPDYVKDGSGRDLVGPIHNPNAQRAPTIQNAEVLDLLTSLVDKSLVAYEEQGGEGRYHLLETVRQYARDRLLDAGEAAVRVRHLEFFLNWAEQGPGLDRLERELDNLRAALAWCRASGVQGFRRSGAQDRQEQPDVDSAGPERLNARTPERPSPAEWGLRLGGALRMLWHVRGYWREGREHLAGLLALPGAEVPTLARAKALQGAGWLAQGQGEYGTARALVEESLAVFRELGHQAGIAHSLLDLGLVSRERGDYAAARALIEESLAIWRVLESKRGIDWSLCGLGGVACDQGDYGAARAPLEESLTIFRELDIKRGDAFSLTSLGSVALSQGDHGAARALFEESLAICREIGEKRGILDDLERLATLALTQTQPERAARLFGAAEGLREAMGTPLPPAECTQHDRSVAGALSTLGEDAFAAAWAEGRGMTLEQTVEYARSENPAA